MWNFLGNGEIFPKKVVQKFRQKFGPPPVCEGLDPLVIGNSRFEGDKFPVLFWKIPENCRLELMTYLQCNTIEHLYRALTKASLAGERVMLHS